MLWKPYLTEFMQTLGPPLAAAADWLAPVAGRPIVAALGHSFDHTNMGVYAVEDPAQFLAAVLRGFGAAKGFGCGLMLIRWARL